MTKFGQPHIVNRNVASNNLSKGLYFALLRLALKTFPHFALNSCYNLSQCHILRQKLLHFAPMLHFVLVVTFCGVTCIIPKVKNYNENKKGVYTRLH